MGYNLKIVVWQEGIDIWGGGDKNLVGEESTGGGEFLGGGMSKFSAGGWTPPPSPQQRKPCILYTKNNVAYIIVNITLKT